MVDIVCDGDFLGFCVVGIVGCQLVDGFIVGGDLTIGDGTKTGI